ncbi:MAG: type I phosphomannose isomerase catalytic subunit [Candidatus Coprenecus sp.]|nr:type I phosphomannose isomerase catalytic subunit [Candidatus Coprenecus sp.]
MKKTIYPYKFVPVLKERVWGGNKLVNEYGKQTDIKGPIGESWELSGFEDDSSVVAQGYMEGNPIYDIIETYMDEIVGEDNYKRFGNEFPLLVKLLDIQERLSLQVHPDDETAFDRHNSWGKSEAWYILDADPGAKVYMGFKRDVTPAEFMERAANGTLEEILNEYPVRKGDFFYIEAGIVHSAGGGLQVAEIQQLSDVTYRIYDWGRENNPATRRQMHLELAIDSINYSKYDEAKYRIPATEHHHGPLTSNEHFTIQVYDLKDMLHIYTDRYESFILYVCLDGKAKLDFGKDGEYVLSKGEVILVPAASADFYLSGMTPDAKVMESYIEKPQDHDEYIEEEDDCHCHDQEGHCHDHCHDHDCSDHKCNLS